MEEEKTYCSDQVALCIETLNWNKRFEKQNASDIYFNVIDDCPLHNSLMQFTKGCKGGISVQLQKTFGNFDLISSFFLKDG